MSLGEKIRLYRTQLNLTQKDLADQVSVTAQAVSRWEQDIVEPGLDTLKRMSEIFSVSLDQLLSNDYVPSMPASTNVPHLDIFKRQIGVCETCNKPILEGEPLHRVHLSRTHQAIYCETCNTQRLERIKKDQIRITKKQRIWGFIWGILGGGFGLYSTITGLNQGFLSNFNELIIGIAFSYALFAFLFTFTMKNNFIHDFFWDITSWGFVKMPGVIFSLDFDGLLFLIGAKILFFFIGLGIALLAGTFALIISLILAGFVFPFSLYNSFAHPEKTDVI
jgi:transcriptional regulator with XRE-family HTH domain